MLPACRARPLILGDAALLTRRPAGTHGRAPPDCVCAACLQGHSSGLRWCEIVDEGRKIVTVSGNRLINLWDLKTGECIKTFPSESQPACLPGTCMSQWGLLEAAASLTSSAPCSDLSRVQSAMQPVMSAWHKYAFQQTVCLLASMIPLHARCMLQSGSLLHFSRVPLAPPLPPATSLPPKVLCQPNFLWQCMCHRQLPGSCLT